MCRKNNLDTNILTASVFFSLSGSLAILNKFSRLRLPLKKNINRKNRKHKLKTLFLFRGFVTDFNKYCVIMSLLF